MNDRTQHELTFNPPADVPERENENYLVSTTEEGTTRREFLAVATTAGLAVAPLLSGGAALAGATPPDTMPGTREVMLHINGADQKLTIEPRVTLLDALRERLHLSGTKKGCDHGQCGACTVLINGRRTLSCLTLAMMQQGAEITTIEGLANGEQLHPMQTAFIEHDAFQCGYCTPGQILSAVGLTQEGHAATDEEIQEQMSGNICRCGAYSNIVSAVREVLEKRHASL